MPVVAEDVLVERLAAAEPEREAPPSSTAEVATPCAMIAGWMRMVGQVTAVVSLICVVAWESAPIVDHTKLLCPCSSFQGWKWSEIQRLVEAGVLCHARLSDELARVELLT